MNAWMRLSMPHGMELSLLATFLFLGVICAAVAFAQRDTAYSISVVIHSVSGLLAVFAADLITLLVAWELLTFSAFFIIRSVPKQGNELRRVAAPAVGASGSARASYRYIAAQICAAVLLFVAMVVQVGRTGSTAVVPLHPEAQPFLLTAVLVKTAMMPFHGWLVGAYTRARVTASVVLSVYATKVGVLTAVRLLHHTPGSVPVLSIIGAVVALAAVVAALLQVSVRRLLSFHVVSQVGHMLAAAGLAGPGDVGGFAATAGLFHAVTHIIYKALLFLTAASVIQRVGHQDLRAMGGLRRQMPLTFVCAVVGAAAISGMPFTSGYASKVLLKEATGYGLQFSLLMAAGVGTALSFIKFVYLIFLRPADGAKVLAPPARGRDLVQGAGMVVLAAMSILIGMAPRLVPGIGRHDFYGLRNLVTGLLPLFGAAALWLVLRRKLIAGHRHVETGGALRRAVARAQRPVLLRIRRLHAAAPQTYFGIAFVIAFVLVLSLTLAS